jgi:hypothetical protein
VHNRSAEGAVNKLLLHKADAVEAVEVVKQAAVDRVAAVEVNHRTLLRPAPGTFARFFLTGAGTWACCEAIRKSI